PDGFKPPGGFQPGGKFPPGGKTSQKTNYLAMPNNRVLIFATSPAKSELDAILSSDGNTPRIGGDLLNQVRSVEGNPGWMVASLEGKAKQVLGKIQAKDLGPMSALAPALPPVQRAKIVSFYVGFSGKNMKFSLGLTCANDSDATVLKNTVNDVWN